MLIGLLNSFEDEMNSNLFEIKVGCACFELDLTLKPLVFLVQRPFETVQFFVELEHQDLYNFFFILFGVEFEAVVPICV